jgi:hypothetical protein
MGFNSAFKGLISIEQKYANNTRFKNRYYIPQVKSNKDCEEYTLILVVPRVFEERQQGKSGSCCHLFRNTVVLPILCRVQASLKRCYQYQNR